MKSTAPPISGTRTIKRERLDRATMRALDEHSTHRVNRLCGHESAWDPLKKKLVRAVMTLSVVGTDSTPLTDGLAAYCAFLAGELELNEALDLPAEEEEARLRQFAPHALEALDARTAPLEGASADPVKAALARVFDDIRAELLAARGDELWTISLDDWTVAA